LSLHPFENCTVRCPVETLFRISPAPTEGGPAPKGILGFLISIVLNVIMQNKPNLCVFWAVSGDCEEKQTQTNPIQTQNKAIFRTKNPHQTQNKPNSNPNKPNSCGPRHSFTQCGLRHPQPPAELQNPARQRNIKTNSLNKNQATKQK
jgi:hypothetical protein